MSTTPKIPTPRTDKWEYDQECNFDVPWEENCRTLERELHIAKLEIEKLRKDSNRYHWLIAKVRGDEMRRILGFYPNYGINKAIDAAMSNSK
jgi:hypothetical protein